MWRAGDEYDAFMGRWSESVAADFVPWLHVPSRARWLDVGCGTGRLTRIIDRGASPASIVGIDPSSGFVQTGRANYGGQGVQLLVGDGQRLPFSDWVFDAAVSGLVLNFVSEPERLVAEQIRVVRPGGTIGWYVWDSTDRMEFLQRFWTVAIELDPAAADVYERIRFSSRQQDALRSVAESTGLDLVKVRAIDVPTIFVGFDDYWKPFLGAQGPSPAYVAGLSDASRRRLRERLRSSLPVNEDGSIPLEARAWAVQGTVRSPQ